METLRGQRTVHPELRDGNRISIQGEKGIQLIKKTDCPRCNASTSIMGGGGGGGGGVGGGVGGGGGGGGVWWGGGGDWGSPRRRALNLPNVKNG